MSEKTKYSKQELEEFQIVINEKLEKANESLSFLLESLSGKNDNGTEETAPTFKFMEDGSGALSKEEINILAGRQQKFIQSLESALFRIQNGTYGKCRVTGKLIPKERLLAVPHTTLAVNAKDSQPSVGKNVGRSYMSTLL